ncbi:MAG: hypothetical protein WED85_13325 [Dehalococcoidia bacterium]
MREAFFLAPARRAFESASAEEQEEFDGAIQVICDDPSLDPSLKARFDVPPVVITRYHDSRVWVVYDLPDEATVRVWMMGFAPDRPRPR